MLPTISVSFVYSAEVLLLGLRLPPSSALVELVCPIATGAAGRPITVGASATWGVGMDDIEGPFGRWSKLTGGSCGSPDRCPARPRLASSGCGSGGRGRAPAPVLPRRRG